tara:strand:- start:1523 stop:2554 length:1032 start_codon:yes stop_codon:yes gene_type:complete
VIGSNGVGKSNLLESVELIGTLRSHRASSDKDMINWNTPNATITAETDEEDVLRLVLNRKGGRQAYKNSNRVSRQSELIGSLRSVGFSSLDLQLVRSEPSLRRNWLDRLIQQLEPVYADLMIRLLKILRQRKQLILSDSFGVSCDEILETLDIQMALVSTRIHRRRLRVLNLLEPLAAKWQKRLSSGKENLNFRYLPGSSLLKEESESTWRDSIYEQLLEQRPVEKRIRNCSVGPQKDEVVFLLNGIEARRYASSGQQRTIVLALKLAELELLERIHGQPPLLILDDVLAELDKTRQLLLLDAVGENHQCLVSATHVDAFEGDWKKHSQILEVDKLKTQEVIS